MLTVLRHFQPKPSPEAVFAARSEKEQLAELLKIALDRDFRHLRLRGIDVAMLYQVNCQDAVVAGTNGTREQGGVRPSEPLVAVRVSVSVEVLSDFFSQSPKTPNKHRTLKSPIKAKTPQTKTPRAKTPQLSKTPRRQVVGRSPFTALNA